MNEAKKSILIAGSIVLCCSAVVAGLAWRNKVDLGRADLVLASRGPDTLLASREKTEIPEERYFERLTSLLHEHYVDDIDDDMKLALGSAKSMVTSLDDLNSYYMDADAFRVYQNALKGQYEGIGVWLVQYSNKAKPSKGKPGPDEAPTQRQPDEAPMLVVTAVVPGSPAEAAGIKPGDWIEAIDDHYVLNPKLLAEFADARKQAESGNLSGEELMELSERLSEKAERVLMPGRARDKVLVGTSGTLKLLMNRAGKTHTFTVKKAVSQMPAVSQNADGSVSLTFQKGAAEQLAQLIKGKSAVTIDLRNSGLGSFEELPKVLSGLAPAGEYGQFKNTSTDTVEPLVVKQGVSEPIQLTLLVDRTTLGPAQIFAMALKEHAGASLVGPEMIASRALIQVKELPEGHGYTLATAVYEPKAAQKVAK